MKKIATTWETKTNQKGNVTIPEIPMGEVTIQIIATNYQTFGDVYQLDQAQQTVAIKLNPPQAQYSEDSKKRVRRSASLGYRRHGLRNRARWLLGPGCGGCYARALVRSPPAPGGSVPARARSSVSMVWRISVLSFRNWRAFSRPWPIRSPL